jgi:hypothetical protein
VKLAKCGAASIGAAMHITVVAMLVKQCPLEVSSKVLKRMMRRINKSQVVVS